VNGEILVQPVKNVDGSEGNKKRDKNPEGVRQGDSAK